MPFSYDYFDKYVGDLVGLLRPATVLDIGPGAGKYGKIVRERSKADGFSCQMPAIEIEEKYVLKFGLDQIYDGVIIDDALTYLLTYPRLKHDLVIIGDCIEHMRKSEGIDLLNFLVYRTGYICVIYPVEFPQDDWEGHRHEAHISTWCPKDFANWDTLHRSWENIRLSLVKGYLPSRMKITG